MAGDTLRIMISSQVEARVFDPPVSLRNLRNRLKDYIEQQLTLGGRQVFDVWLCEQDVGSSIDSWWQTSRDEVRQADLVLVLYTGEAGTRVKENGLGICHAELYEAAQFSREKVLPVIALGDPVRSRKKADKAFQQYVEELKPWPNQPANETELHLICAQVLAKSIVKLVKKGVRRRRGASFDVGNALDWSKLDFVERKQKIEAVLLEYFVTGGGKVCSAPAANGMQAVVAALDGQQVLWCVHAIPAAASQAAAREMVGQPFLHDHLMVPLLQQHGCAGPVHLVGCHKGITESQALKMLGVIDCTVVKTEFGLYLADRVQQIQMLFLAHCRDLTSTRSALTELFQWVDLAEEDEDIVRTARSRTAILQVIARELHQSTG